MRSILALLVLSFAALPSANASIVLGTDLDPSFSTTVTILTDASFVPVASAFSSNNVIINPVTAEFALLVDDGTVDTTVVGTIPDLTQTVLFAINLATFTGTSINAIGIPTTPLANTALTEILGLNVLGLTLVGDAVPTEGGFLLTYNVTSITQIPEPATMWLLAAGGGLVLLRKRYSRT